MLVIVPMPEETGESFAVWDIRANDFLRDPKWDSRAWQDAEDFLQCFEGYPSYELIKARVLGLLQDMGRTEDESNA